MKKTISKLSVIGFSLVLLLCLSACGNKAEKTDLWENAVYTEDTEIGNGAKTVEVEVKAEDKSVTFTVKTDKAILGDALTELGLIEGENGPYGLYIKKVNGITADYDTNGAYWAFYENGEYAMAGVDSTEIAGGEQYALVYTKE